MHGEYSYRIAYCGTPSKEKQAPSKQRFVYSLFFVLSEGDCNLLFLPLAADSLLIYFSYLINCGSMSLPGPTSQDLRGT